MTNRDRIFLEGIKFHGYHGLTRLEREIGVRLAVDVSLELDLSAAGASDHVGDTVDYRKVHQRVVELGRARSHKLLESFAMNLVEKLMAEFGAERVCITVRKETPVLDGIVDSVGVSVCRSRSDGRGSGSRP